MGPDPERATERSRLLSGYHDRRFSTIQQEDEASSIIASYVSKDEQALGSATVGERLPYNDYTTIDWLHDLVSLCRPTFKLTPAELVLDQIILSLPRHSLAKRAEMPPLQHLRIMLRLDCCRSDRHSDRMRSFLRGRR